MTNEFPSSFVQPWKKLVQWRKDADGSEFPCYTPSQLDTLITTSSPTSLFLGTGHSIYQRALIPAILSAKESIHFVTCFWADSPTLKSLGDAFLELANIRAQQQHEENLPILHITIGFSSRGVLQKLLHTSSKDGYLYSADQWPSLGLPDAATLQRGSIQLTVKTLFFTPFSIMHPKYLVIDDTTAWIPSCNVSWEQWFEGCIELHGGAVEKLLNFHERVWGMGSKTRDRETDDAKTPLILAPENADAIDGREGGGDAQTTSSLIGGEEDGGITAIQSTRLNWNDQVPTILLPSSHHRNPAFSWIPLSRPSVPMTPLNAALLTLFANAKHWISIVTPNVTSRSVVDSILAAVGRGVDVEIRTGKNMMLMEQLVTAGTTTSWCLSRLIKQYKLLVDQRRLAQSTDPESQLSPIGQLKIFYYQPMQSSSSNQEDNEPVMSHFKMTLVDGEYLVLGSGNMDRASWWTSQELGILFYVPGFEEHHIWERILKNRAEVVFRSG